MSGRRMMLVVPPAPDAAHCADAEVPCLPVSKDVRTPPQGLPGARNAERYSPPIGDIEE